VARQTLSEQHNNNNARIAGDNACSNFNNNNVNNGNRFRAVFRPNDSLKVSFRPAKQNNQNFYWQAEDKFLIFQNVFDIMFFLNYSNWRVLKNHKQN